jgi:NADPH2:quinone reductase
MRARRRGEAVGEGVTHVKPGDRVLALVMHGAFAEEALADARTVVPIPDAIDFATAASFMFTYGTSYHALKDRAALQPGKRCSCSARPAAWARRGGARQADGGARDRRRVERGEARRVPLARAERDDRLHDRGPEERVKALTGGRGVDVVYDPVGGDYSEAACAAWHGRAVSSSSASPTERFPGSRSTSRCSRAARSLAYSGEVSRRRNRRRTPRTFASWSAISLRPSRSPRVGPVSLARGVDALRAMQERRVKGKVVVLPEE